MKMSNFNLSIEERDIFSNAFKIATGNLRAEIR